MYDCTEFDEIADQIASDIPARDGMSMAEAISIARAQMFGESAQVIDNVATALWRSFQPEA